LRSFAALFGFVACRNEGISVLTSRAIDTEIRSICHMIVIPVLALDQGSHGGPEGRVLKRGLIRNQFPTNQKQGCRHNLRNIYSRSFGFNTNRSHFFAVIELLEAQE
jgi:hypothetical protein